MGMYENIGREMMITLERSAWTSIINLCRDFSVGIADDACNLVAVPDTALPVQAMTMQRIMKSTAEFFEGEIEDGDVLMCNLAYLGNTHMGEPLLASPVFHEGELMFWSMARGHLADMGTPAYVPTYPYSKDLYSEGLKIPPIKLFERGKLRKDVLELYLGNLRARTQQPRRPDGARGLHLARKGAACVPDRALWVGDRSGAIRPSCSTTPRAASAPISARCGRAPTTAKTGWTATATAPRTCRCASN